ncbi:hypothetical protein GCM10009830_26790 [Glycomyces endophyticus]|uniref:Uncharacterized protein n=1 Tax=Glycomyces endophyticus TaxID=480996 RepID=A0ABP4SUR7_9ACTN
MVEMIFAGVLVGAVVTAAVITGARDRRMRRRLRDDDEFDSANPAPIPAGWHAAGTHNPGITSGMDAGSD